MTGRLPAPHPAGRLEGTGGTAGVQGGQTALLFVDFVCVFYLFCLHLGNQCGFLKLPCFLWIENKNKGKLSNRDAQLPA